MKKKKGFTLVELIASMAIFSIALTYLLMGSETGNIIFRNENKKQETITATQQLIELFKSRKDIEMFYNEDGLKQFYIVFDYDDLNNISKDLDDIKYKDVKFQNWYRGAEDPSCEECKTKCNDKNLGALVEIYDDTDNLKSNKYNVYKLKVTVWNLKDKSNYESNLSTYISR